MAAIAKAETSAGPTGVLPGALENMSRARGIEPDAVVGALATEFDVTSDGGRSALRRYYHRVRTGQLLGSRITHRLLAALARIFDAEPEDFIAAVRPVGAAPRLSVAPAMPRPSGESPRTPTRAAAEPANAHPDEELVKRLFCRRPRRLIQPQPRDDYSRSSRRTTNSAMCHLCLWNGSPSRCLACS